ncbi:MAG: porin family protein [Bacteroidota bacterium]
MYKNFPFTNTGIFTVALLLCSLTSLSAQRDLRFGIQASPTFSGMTTDNNLINRDGTNLGLKLGLIGEYYIGETYSIHTGLGFHFNAGGTLFYEDRFTAVDIWETALDEVLISPPDSLPGGSGFKYDLQYLEIPIGLTLRTREFGYLRYYVRPALHLGFLTRSRGSLTNSSLIDSEENFNISKEVNGVNLGWSLGAGVEYSLSTNTKLLGGLAFQSGFADVTTDSGAFVTREGRGPTEDDSRGKINSIVITIGVMF